MIIFELDEFMAALQAEFKNGEFPTIISERQFEVLREVAKDVMSKGQTNHIYGKSENSQSSGGGTINQNEKPSAQSDSTTGSIECPVCHCNLTITLST